MHEEPDFIRSYDQELDIGHENETLKPRMYRVLLHNDDYTTMDFVVYILMTIFHKPAAEATRIMLDVHKKGQGVCGIYTYDIASTKIAQVHFISRQREFPLRCSMDEA
ncbi:MAG: ATP-dependent Clp protease adapter protein ClpS [Syntrophus sp. PtaU1.Bin208]|nr:MAG: ATP-dependent Clp protease adapter protein ClpS [Syntrophus sp. PtaU1.Bin208]